MNGRNGSGPADSLRIRVASKIVMRPTALLLPYAGNARTHNEAQLDALERAIRRFGFVTPVAVADDAEGFRIWAGHARVIVAHDRIGMPNVPTIDISYLTEEERRAYALADNQIALLAGWDEELLRAEMIDLNAIGFDLSFTGFAETDIRWLLDRGGAGKDPEEAPAPPDPDKAIARLGDVWLLGRHRLACGDATDPDTVAAVLAGAEPHLMVTDPPYGVDYDPNWRNLATQQAPPGSVMKNRALGGQSLGAVRNDTRADWREAWALFPGAVAYVWHSGLHASIVDASLVAAGFEIRSQIVWVKQMHVIGRGHYHWRHEPCWYAVRKGQTGRWHGDRRQTTVWEIQSQIGVTKGAEEDGDHSIHSTQKPIECMRRPIENNSKPGDGVYEPFSGSGTTIIAAEVTARRCFAVELFPPYVDVAIERWQQLTGQEAIRERDGATFTKARGALTIS